MGSAYQWLTRCIPAFSVCAVAILLVYSFIVSPLGNSHDGAATPPQLILSLYTVFCHILSIVFPIRVCWAIRDVIKRMRAAAMETPHTARRRQRSTHTRKSSGEDPVPLFVCILPAYKEEIATLEETLRVLASHAQASSSYHVYLAMEEKEENSACKAARLVKTFEHSFYRMSFTIHPANIPGEAQGKSSNEAWAAKQAMRDYTEDNVKQNTIFTVMDADTHLSSRYFSQIARIHAEFPGTNQTTIYVPPLVFDRNLHHVPLPVRTADLMWAGAGISSLYTGSTVCIPTSVYSLPMTLVELVDGWDTGPGAIGEDMHMYLKCFFALSGNITPRIIYAAASQCNVNSGERGVYGYYTGCLARYCQALRHMFGSLDSGYSVRQAVSMIKRHRQAELGPASTTGLPSCAPDSNWAAFYTSADLHTSFVSTFPGHRNTPPKPIDWYNVYVLFHRLYEAHFLPIHLCSILITSGMYTFSYPSFLVPNAFKLALDISSICRLIGWCTMLCYFYLYESYHKLCVVLRKEEMRQAGLLKRMEENDGFTPSPFQTAGLFEAMLFPIGGVIFGALPGLQAAVTHLFTERLVYVVSLKPKLPAAWRDTDLMTPSSYTAGRTLKPQSSPHKQPRTRMLNVKTSGHVSGVNGHLHRRRFSQLIQFTQTDD